jgi:hypothetical protein
MKAQEAELLSVAFIAFLRIAVSLIRNTNGELQRSEGREEMPLWLVSIIACSAGFVAFTTRKVSNVAIKTGLIFGSVEHNSLITRCLRRLLVWHGDCNQISEHRTAWMHIERRQS